VLPHAVRPPTCLACATQPGHQFTRVFTPAERPATRPGVTPADRSPLLRSRPLPVSSQLPNFRTDRPVRRPLSFRQLIQLPIHPALGRPTCPPFAQSTGPTPRSPAPTVDTECTSSQFARLLSHRHPQLGPNHRLPIRQVPQSPLPLAFARRTDSQFASLPQSPTPQLTPNAPTSDSPSSSFTDTPSLRRTYRLTTCRTS